jgi:histidinol phosphatase-like enzyme
MKQLDKIIAFDLDDVICTRPKGYEDLGVEKYRHCEPVEDMVKIVNDTYDAGYTIKIYTARGMSVFNGDTHKIYSNLYELTFNQLNDWGVKFHSLVMGKLHYDLLIDDKTVFSENITSLGDIKTIVND